MWLVTILVCLWWVSNLNVGQNSFITKSITWSSIIQIFNKLPPNLNLNLCFILRVIFYQSWIDWIRYFSMISLIFQQLNIYTLDASIFILITHFLWGQSPIFETFMFGAWLDGVLRWRATNDIISTYHHMHQFSIERTHCKNARCWELNRCVNCCGELE